MKGCRPLSDTEIASILKVLDRGTFPKRDRALFLLGLRSGFRISELLSLTLGDVYQNGQFVDRISVSRKFMKKKLEGRTVMLHPEAKKALEQLVLELESRGRGTSKQVLFCSREGMNEAMDRRSAWHMLRAASKKCGITGKIGTHCMRKTFAKKVHEKLGKDLMKTQKALGHKQITSTTSYLSFNEEDVDDAILKS